MFNTQQLHDNLPKTKNEENWSKPSCRAQLLLLVTSSRGIIELKLNIMQPRHQQPAAERAEYNTDLIFVESKAQLL